MYKFIKPLADERRDKEIKKKKQNETAIEKLKLKYPLYIKDETSTDANVVKLSTLYGKTVLFQAGEQNDIFSAKFKDQVLQQEAVIIAVTIPSSKPIENIEETKKNTFKTFGK